MKFFLAVTILSLPLVSLAASRDIYDIMYLPKAGNSYGFSEATYVTAGQDFLDDEVKGYAVAQTLGHALTDNFSLQVALDFAELESDFGASTATSSGVSDPTFTGRYRLTDDTFRLDLIGGLLIGPGIAESDPDGDMNRYTGGAQFNLGAQFGQKHASSQWALSAKYIRSLEATHKDSGVTSREDASNAAEVKAAYMFKLAESSIVRTTLTLAWGEQHQTDNDSTTYLQSLSQGLNLEYQYVFSKDFLARVGVGYAVSEFGYGIVKGSEAASANIGANYQF
jgi:hypothetical protein